MPREEKTFVPKCYVKEFGEYGQLNVSFEVSELIKFAEANKDAKGYLRITISKRRQPGQYGDTHTATLNTWKPEMIDSGTRNNPAPKPKNEPKIEEPYDQEPPF